MGGMLGILQQPGVMPLLSLICNNEVANNGKSIIALVYLS